MSDWCIEHGDCLEVLRTLPDACVDSIVTDPPAGISFMSKSWDNPGSYGFSDGADRIGSPPTVNLGRNPTCQACGGRKRAGAKTKACTCEAPQWNDPNGKDREAFVGFMTAVMSECLRVLKPGGHALVWAIPRTSHWTAMACELAGFEVRDRVTHLFGSGFPKSLNVSKAIDAADGLKDSREVVSTYTAGGNAGVATADKGGTYGVGVGVAAPVELSITRGASERSRAWDGWGTALKPAAEDWWLLRKPLAGTVARNVLEHGTGAINVDGCRAGTQREPAGRWPANVVLSHSPDCDWHELDNGRQYVKCATDCPVAMLDARSGNRPGMSGGGTGRRDNSMFGVGGITKPETVRGDSGGASRFFYTAKTSTKEREAGLGHLPKRSPAEQTGRAEGSAGLQNPRAGAGRTSKGRANHHPTVKPLALMRYLVRLITPPGGLVLDPFTGSGSTGCAAVLEGMNFLGIEQDADYVTIATARIAHWQGRAA